MLGWFQKGMENRKAHVEVNGKRSKEYLFKQGLPQGSVLSPLLFRVYINDLLEERGEEVRVSGFADDRAVWATGKDVQRCRAGVQAAVGKVWEWSKRWLMTVVVEKCSATLFSMDAKDAKMEAVRGIETDGMELRVEVNTTFLGDHVRQELDLQCPVEEGCREGEEED